MAQRLNPSQQRTDMSQTHRTVYITGGTGFLGRQIVSRAQAAGYTVLAPRSAEANLETNDGVDAFFERAAAAGTPVQAIIHSAAYYGGIGINKHDPAGLISRNTRMSTHLWEAAARHGVQKVVSVGSACGYPGHLTSVMTEADFFNGRCHGSVEAYGFNKRIHCVFGAAYHRQHGIDFNQVALTNIYGEHDVFQEYRSHVISALIKKIADAKLGLIPKPTLWGSGTPLREFAHVSDAAAVIVDALHWQTDYDPINLDGEEISIRGLAELIAELVGYEGGIDWDASQPDGVPRKCLSGEKLRSVVTYDYQPLSLRAGLRQTIDWYLANKDAADARE